MQPPSCPPLLGSGRPNLTELWAGPNCSHQIGTECEHNEWFTGRCWPQDSSSFTHGVHKRLVFLAYSHFRSAAAGEPASVLLYVDLIYVNAWLDYLDLTLTIAVGSCALKILKIQRPAWLHFPGKKPWKFEQTEETLKRNSHVTLNRCLDLCYKQSTNHHSHPSLWSAAPLVCNQPVSGCKFPSQTLRTSSGERWLSGCEETCSVLPGHCVSVGVRRPFERSEFNRHSQCVSSFPVLDVFNHFS